MTSVKVYNKYHKDAPADAVYIGRGSPYGNPFTVDQHGRELAIKLFIRWLDRDFELKSKMIRELKGKNLVCFCAPNLCHGDYLLRICNEVTE